MSATHVNLTAPSEAYREATLSLVYRLAELMFGSLLAAYSLGFVGAIAAHWAELSQHRVWGIILLSAQYASISVAFAYLTTSFYLTYHAGILTMPQMPLARLGVDFTLAIVQAVIFGLSILCPALFPILLGINFYLSGRRKNREYDELASTLFNGICERKGRNVPDALPKFSHELANLLRTKFPELSGWGPVGSDILQSAKYMIILGSTVGLVCLAGEFSTTFFAITNHWWLESKWIVQQSLITVEVVWITKRIVSYGWGAIQRRATFLGFRSRILMLIRKS